MKKVLILSDINFWEDSSGHRTRLKSLISYLASKAIVTVINTGPAPSGTANLISQKYQVECIILEQCKVLSSTGYGRRLKKIIQTRKFDVVIIEYIHSSYFLNFLEGEPLLILDIHDIISERTEQFKYFGFAGESFELTKETEQEILKVYDYVMTLCIPDKHKLDIMLEAKKVLLCPYPVCTVDHPPRKTINNIIYVASSYLPNVDAINYFIRYCWPDIIAKYGQLLLIIYGTVSSKVDKFGQTNIMLLGFEPDLNIIYQSADIVINPVRFGAGLKIKNLEALAHGIPLITTRHGSRGLDPLINKGFIVADTAYEFIAAISLLIKNELLREELITNGKRFITENFSPFSCYAPLIRVINEH